MRRISLAVAIALAAVGVSVVAVAPAGAAAPASPGCVVEAASAAGTDPTVQEFVIRVRVRCATATVEVINTASGRDCGTPASTVAVDSTSGVITSSTTVDCLVTEAGLMAVDSRLTATDPLVPAAMAASGAGTAWAMAGRPETITSTIEVGSRVPYPRGDTDVVVTLASSHDTHQTRIQLLACLGDTDLPSPDVVTKRP